MDDEVNLAEKLASYNDNKILVGKMRGEFKGAEILLIEPMGTPNTGDSGVEAAPEDEI